VKSEEIVFQKMSPHVLDLPKGCEISNDLTDFVRFILIISKSLLSEWSKFKLQFLSSFFAMFSGSL